MYYKCKTNKHTHTHAQTHLSEYFESKKPGTESEKFIMVMRQSPKAVEILVLDFFNCDGQGIYSLWLSQIAETILRKENKARGVMLPDLRQSYRNQSSMVLAQKTDT